MSKGYPLLQRISAATSQAIYDGLNRWLPLLNGAINGKLNVVFDHENDFTLTANAATTTLTDARISPGSAIVLVPRTANASAEMAGGALFHDTPSAGSVVWNHANNAQTDRTFRAVIIGG